MAQNSNIQWTDHTANFWWGCFKVSDGCKHCYAETLSNRYGKSIWGPPQHSPRELKKGIWKELPKWNEQAEKEGIRKRVFVQSMADFFEDHHQLGEWRRKAICLMEQCEWLDFQVLTKRPENILSMVPISWQRNDWPARVWAGTSVENQATADSRIVDLLPVPAAVRFLSCEPLLGPIDLMNIKGVGESLYHCRVCYGSGKFPLKGDPLFECGATCPECSGLNPVDWVIVGGESGNHARPFDLQWARDIVQQCQAAGVPVFVKQMGSNPVDNGRPVHFKDKKGGAIDEWPIDLRIREFPQ